MANTWLNMKSMIGSFLSSVWKQGGLAGAVPEDTFGQGGQKVGWFYSKKLLLDKK